MGQNLETYSTIFVSQAIKDVIVAKHNEFRARIANGKETEGADGPEPPASDMLALTWDDGLAEMAQRYYENYFCSSYF